MKKNQFLILAIITIVLFSGCKKVNDSLDDKTLLSVTITQNPTGGSQIDQLIVKFDGTVVHLSVETRVEWWWEDSNHENAILKDWAPYGFSSPNDNAVISKTTVYTAKTGYILMNYYWVKISWDDDNGHHLVESSKAYCHD